MTAKLTICERPICRHLSPDHPHGGRCHVAGCRCTRLLHGKEHDMEPSPMVSIVNQSKLVTAAEATLIALALGVQLSSHVAPVHGLVPAVEFVPNGGATTAGSTPLYLQDDPDVDGALGYHDVDDNGDAYIKVFVRPTLDNGGTVLSGPDSVSVTCSHEIVELVGDEDANVWADAPDGDDYARELCDAVEGDAYPVTFTGGSVSVSNFVLPAFFNRKRKPKSARFDFLGKLPAPFTMTAGGYQIRRTEPGNVDQVVARHLAAHPSHAAHSPAPGIALLFGEHFPAWKRPYKSRKAKSRARHA